MAPSISDNVEISATPQLPSQPNAFDKFTLFPKLPIELRLMIWKLALPRGSGGDGKRLLCVAGVLNGEHKIIEGQSVECKFRVVTVDERLNLNCGQWKDLTEDHERCLKAEAQADEEDLRDVRLLKTGGESRGVFLQGFPNTLSVYSTNNGQIRFNDECTLYVVNLLEYGFSKKISGAQRPKCGLHDFEKVRLLAVDIPRPYDWESGCSGLLLFRKLVSVKASYFPHTRLANICQCCGDGSSEKMTDIFDILREKSVISQIELRISQINSDFRLPNIEHPH